MDSRVASVLETAFPDRPVADVAAAGPSWNDSNHTVRVEFADGSTIYLKIASDGERSRIARERAAIAYVDESSEVPVPTVVASSTDGPVPYIVTEPVVGQSLQELWIDSSQDERAALARQVGTALARVHTHRFDDHGHITGGDADGIELETGPWTDVLVDTIETMRTLASADRFGHHFDAVIAAVEANRSLLEGTPAALLHGDPARPNCFRSDGTIGLLDWEIAHVGDPARELVRARDQVARTGSVRSDAPDRLVTALYDGYRDRAGGLPSGFDDRRPVYEAVRFLGVSGFFDKYVEFLDESPDEFASWVRAEMDRRLAAIS